MAFSTLAAVGPEGLVPAVGTGGSLAARHLEQAALSAVAAGPVLPRDVVDALAHAASEAWAQAGGANALNPRGVAIAVRREVACVRGLAMHSMVQDDVFEVMWLGTFLPRAAWMSALLLSRAGVARSDPDSAAATWHAAALIAGTHPGTAPQGVDILRALLTDDSVPSSVAYSIDEVTAALFALSRTGLVTQVALPLARATAARLDTAARQDEMTTDPERAIGEALDLIGVLAASGTPQIPGPPPVRSVGAGDPRITT